MPAANPELAEMIALRSLIAAATTAETAIPVVGAIRSSIWPVCLQTGARGSSVCDRMWAKADVVSDEPPPFEPLPAVHSDGAR